MRIVHFLDTNVLIYSALGRQDDARKFDIATRLIAQDAFGVSGQVLAEFYVGVTRQASKSLSNREADRWIDLLSRMPFVATDKALVKAAIDVARRYQIHYYDAAIIAASERLGSEILYTEDLNHGQRYGSVLVQNPFRDP